MKNSEGKEITGNDVEYYNSLAILHDIEKDEDSHTEEAYQEAKQIVDDVKYEIKRERESSYRQSHYPNAPEGSIWDY